MTSALVLLGQGAEEMEVVIIVDVLRRAEIRVILAGVDGPEPVTCSRNLRILPDCALASATGPFDCIVLPGGAEGAKRLAASPAVGVWLRAQESAGGVIAAICAAPVALVAHGIAKNKRMTSHPSVREAVSAHGIYQELRVVEDARILTSRGPGTAFEFALALVTLLEGAEKADLVRKPMLLA